MRAVALTSTRKLEHIAVPEPDPWPDDLKIRVHSAGICGSDLGHYLGVLDDQFRSVLPGEGAGELAPVMGHEFTGEVVAVGSEVTGFVPGDLVTINPGGQACRECPACSGGQLEACTRRGGPGIHRPGAFADYVVTKHTSAYKLPPGTDLDSLALAEPLAVSLFGIKRADIQPGDAVLVTGAGPIGVLAILAAKRAGAAAIYASDPASLRREVAARAGAIPLDPGAAPVARQIAEHLGRIGVERAIECAGVPEAMQDCVDSLRPAGFADESARPGRVTMVSLFKGAFSVDLLRLMLFSQEIVGSYGSSGMMREAVRLLLSGEIDVRPVVGPSVTLDDLPATFAGMADGSALAGKVLVKP